MRSLSIRLDAISSLLRCVRRPNLLVAFTGALVVLWGNANHCAQISGFRYTLAMPSPSSSATPSAFHLTGIHVMYSFNRPATRLGMIEL